ncbi:MAG: hypothetical protein JW744_00440 [Candidatus Diapherotrites archaeon]|uniref:Uncharacterized protein n=1 Tax=Candidatus Iainarchaeum sp. TaxID=3101447 RepID=A0A939C601_9ARCH|nr:hypothetical protein [Candidatus Diapherotrites archaeon]
MYYNPLSLTNERTKAPKLIIQALCEEWPLSVTALHKRLNARYSYPISYQGAHKTIRRMLKENVLEKQDKHHYKISHQWVNELDRFLTYIKNSYKNHRLEFPV